MIVENFLFLSKLDGKLQLLGIMAKYISNSVKHALKNMMMVVRILFLILNKISIGYISFGCFQR